MLARLLAVGTPGIPKTGLKFTPCGGVAPQRYPQEPQRSQRPLWLQPDATRDFFGMGQIQGFSTTPKSN